MRHVAAIFMSLPREGQFNGPFGMATADTAVIAFVRSDHSLPLRGLTVPRSGELRLSRMQQAIRYGAVFPLSLASLVEAEKKTL